MASPELGLGVGLGLRVDKSMSCVEVVLKHVLKRGLGAAGAAGTGAAPHAPTALAVLMNACLDDPKSAPTSTLTSNSAPTSSSSAAPAMSVRKAVYAHGGMEEALKGLALGLQGGGNCSGNSSSDDDAEDRALLLSRQAGLMSRLATVDGAQAVLYRPDNYRLMCRGIAAATANPNPNLNSTPIISPTPMYHAESGAHLVRTLAALNTPPPACRQVALEECLVEALLRIFPQPRLDLGEVTPESVILPPLQPASPVLLGNAARCLMPYADDAAHAAVLFQRRALLGVEKIINAVATCGDIRVRKNLAILLAKGCRLEGVREVISRFRGLEMLLELQDKLVPK